MLKIFVYRVRISLAGNFRKMFFVGADRAEADEKLQARVIKTYPDVTVFAVVNELSLEEADIVARNSIYDCLDSSDIKQLYEEIERYPNSVSDSLKSRLAQQHSQIVDRERYLRVPA